MDLARHKIIPRDWQREALHRWKRERRGIVRVVTGGGKTIFAEMCLLDYLSSNTLGKILIIVPTVSLLDQWCIALQEDIGLSTDQIGLLSSQERPGGAENIFIAVINSARKPNPKIPRSDNVFLIVDECHRAGSPINAKALEGNFGATLGLSATPERDYDAGFENLILPRLGPIIYDYTYIDAYRDNVISKFSLSNISVDFLDDEKRNYNKLSRAIALHIKRHKLDNNDDEYLKRLLQKRAEVSANATMRIPIASKIVEEHKGERIIIFHERISAANIIVSVLKNRGHRVTTYHAGIGPNIRRENLRLFRKGIFDVLVCCRALDEGINIPEASIAIIASSTASQRQRIQRLGRVLRKAKNKDSAIIYTLFATEEEKGRLQAEESTMEDIASISWKKGFINKHA